MQSSRHQVMDKSAELDQHLAEGIAALKIPSPFVQPEKTPMNAPGSFAAQLKAMMDEAKSGLAQARTDGLAKVGEAVGKLNEAKAAVATVSGTMAKTIEDEAAAVMSELGQVSNDLGGGT